jgi:hypothetical protein
MRFLFTKTFSRRTKEGANSIRKVTSIKFYEDGNTNDIVTFTDLEVTKFHREKKIREFFTTYSCRKRYSLIEYVIDYNDTDKLDRFFFALKKSLKENNSELLGYIRLVDIGENGGIHHHITVAITKIDFKGKEFPKHLKRTFNGRKVHGEFVRCVKKIMNYYIPKDIIELGIRKRTFVRSQKYKEIKANSSDIIDNKLPNN